MRRTAIVLALAAVPSVVVAQQQPAVVRNGQLMKQPTMQPIANAPVDVAKRENSYRFSVPVHVYVDAHPLISKESDPSLAKSEIKIRAALQVDPAGWFDTHVVLVPGDRVRFASTGRIRLPDARVVTPQGSARGWKDLLRLFPLNSARVGELIGTVGKTDLAVPFAIGAGREVDVQQAGELFLRVNLSRDLQAEGSYKVTLVFDRQGTPAEAETATLQIDPHAIAELPRRVTDEAGNAGDMVNLALLGTVDQVRAAFREAGWVSVDTTRREAVFHGLEATLDKQPYIEVPMSTLYLLGRPQNFSYARADPFTVAASRHHLRVWNMGRKINGVELWAGAATHDIGFSRDGRTNGVTHRIDPAVDRERDFVLETLRATGKVAAAAYVTPGDALVKARTATGESFHSNGAIAVLELR